MARSKSPLEDSVEGYLVKRVKELGGMALKGDIKGQRFLDRIIILPGGVTVWCECKRPDGTGRYSKHQDETLKRLDDMAHQTLRIETKQEVDAFLKTAYPAPKAHVQGLEPIGEVDANGSLKWFNPPIRRGTTLYAAPGSTLRPEEVECVCKRAVCSYDADFGCGVDRSKERHDV